MTRSNTLFYIVFMVRTKAVSKRTKPKQELTVGLHSRISNQLFEQIVEVAEVEKRTFSNMVRILLEEGLAHWKGNRTP